MKDTSRRICLTVVSVSYHYDLPTESTYQISLSFKRIVTSSPNNAAKINYLVLNKIQAQLLHKANVLECEFDI